MSTRLGAARLVEGAALTRSTMAASPPHSDAPRSRRHDEAVDAAARAAQRHGLSVEAFQDSVVGVRDDVEAYQRALHSVELRTTTLHMRPGPGRSRDPKPLPTPASVDPWVVDVNALAEATRVVGWCPACMGSGATKCAACKGAGKTKCPRCDATGRDAKGAECGQCAGQKKLPCGACRAGQVDCDECHAAGEVEAWLEVERSTRQVVCVHPMGSAARAHPRVSEAADFDGDPARWPDALVEDTGMRAPGELAAGLAPKLPPSERVVATRVQRFQSVVHLVTYATALSTGVVQVGGTPLEASPTADWRPAELRRIVTRAGAVGALVAALAVSLSYGARHPWYAQTGHTPAVVGLACALALAGAWVLSGLTLAPRARSPLRLGVPAGALMLLVGATAMVLARDRPRASGALAALERGDLARASLEADALRALDVDRAAGESVLDQVHLRALRAAAPDTARMAAIARAPWYRDAARAQAVNLVVAALERDAAAPATRSDPDALARVADQAQAFSPPLRERLLRDAAMARAGACAERADGRCVREQTTAALQRGADPAQTATLLRRAHARMREVFQGLIAQSEAHGDHAARERALTEALTLSEAYTALTREETSPTAAEVRERLTRVRQQERERDEPAPRHARSR